MNIVTKNLNKPNSTIYKKIYHVKAEFSLKCKVGLTLENLLFWFTRNTLKKKNKTKHMIISIDAKKHSRKFNTCEW